MPRLRRIGERREAKGERRKAKSVGVRMRDEPLVSLRSGFARRVTHVSRRALGAGGGNCRNSVTQMVGMNE